MTHINLAPQEKKESLRNSFLILPYAELEKLSDNELVEIVGRHHDESNVLIVRDEKKRYYEISSPVTLDSSTKNPLVSAITEKKLEELVRQEPALAEVKTLRKLAEGHYLLSDVLKHPWKASLKGIFGSELRKDFLILPGERNFKKALLTDALSLLSFSMVSLPYELMHAGMNTLTGGTNKEIVINTLYGGDIAAKLIPGVKSDWLFPLIGGYVDPKFISTYGEMATELAPYMMTPLGFYCILKGKEKKNLPLTFAGLGALSAHLGGAIGDFFTFGRTVMTEGIDIAYHCAGYQDAPDSPWLYVPVIAGGFYIGLKTIRFTYRLSKGLINSVLDYSHNVSTGMKPSLLERAKTGLESYLQK